MDYVVDIIYDVNGRPYACFYQGIIYYYVCNLQGDVIRIINGNTSQTLVEYTYDAWGNIIEITGLYKDTLGTVNPIRYRGYYYDTETGFYYCQSRYYDPAIGRWINADGYASAGQGFVGFNMFAYCNNNPIMYSDPGGYRLDSNQFGPNTMVYESRTKPTWGPNPWENQEKTLIYGLITDPMGTTEKVKDDIVQSVKAVIQNECVLDVVGVAKMVVGIKGLITNVPKLFTPTFSYFEKIYTVASVVVSVYNLLDGFVELFDEEGSSSYE